MLKHNLRIRKKFLIVLIIGVMLIPGFANSVQAISIQEKSTPVVVALGNDNSIVEAVSGLQYYLGNVEVVHVDTVDGLKLTLDEANSENVFIVGHGNLEGLGFPDETILSWENAMKTLDSNSNYYFVSCDSKSVEMNTKYFGIEGQIDAVVGSTMAIADFIIKNPDFSDIKSVVGRIESVILSPEFWKRAMNPVNKLAITWDYYFDFWGLNYDAGPNHFYLSFSYYDTYQGTMNWWVGIDGDSFVTNPHNSGMWMFSDPSTTARLEYALNAAFGKNLPWLFPDTNWYKGLDDYSQYDKEHLLMSAVWLLVVQKIVGKAINLIGDMLAILGIPEEYASKWTDVVSDLLTGIAGFAGFNLGGSFDSFIDDIATFSKASSGIEKTVIAVLYLLRASDWSVNTVIDLMNWEIRDGPPAKVKDLLATPITHYWIILGWSTSTELDFDHYNVYRNGIYLDKTTSTTFSDMALTASTTYTFEVSAVDHNGNEGEKASISATTPAPPEPSPDPICTRSMCIE